MTAETENTSTSAPATEQATNRPTHIVRKKTGRGKNADFEQVERTRRSLAELAHIDPDKPLWSITEQDLHDAVIERYRLLNSAASLVVVVSLDDAAMVPNRPNMPGTIDQYPNWKLALPLPVDSLMDTPLSRDLVAMMNESRGPRPAVG